MKNVFNTESIASEKTQKKALFKISELAISIPKGFFYTIKVNGSLDRRRRVNIGGTYFDLVFYIWDLKGNQVKRYVFEDSDGTSYWNRLYEQIKKDIKEL